MMVGFVASAPELVRALGGRLPRLAQHHAEATRDQPGERHAGYMFRLLGLEKSTPWLARFDGQLPEGSAMGIPAELEAHLDRSRCSWHALAQPLKPRCGSPVCLPERRS